jgi:hypothetical protein
MIPDSKPIIVLPPVKVAAEFGEPKKLTLE